MTKHPSTFELQCHFAGTSDVSQKKQEMAVHIQECPSCQRVIQQLEAAQSALTARKPASLLWQQLETRAKNETRQTRRWRIGAVGAVAASGVLGVVLLMVLGVGEPLGTPESSRQQGVSQGPSDSGTRWMGGGVTAKVHVRRGGETFVLDGARPKTGDQLRYEVTRAGADMAYASVFAVQDGAVIPLLPQANAKTPYEFSGHLVIPGSVVVEAGGEDVTLFLFVKSKKYTLESIETEMSRRLRQKEDLSKIDGLVHRMNATPESETK